MVELVHATVIAVAGRAVLIRGASGTGKSDLALRCLAVPPGPFAAAAPVLVADDRVEAEAQGDHVRLTSSAAIRGLLEVRGIGIVAVAFVAEAELALVADIVVPGAIERMPTGGLTAVVCGLTVPRVLVDAREASAPLKLLLALAQTAK